MSSKNMYEPGVRWRSYMYEPGVSYMQTATWNWEVLEKPEAQNYFDRFLMAKGLNRTK